jgi:aspartyl aminopeptidase
MPKNNNSKLESFNKSLFSFLDSSPTPFHCVSEAVRELSEQGFVYLDESVEWHLEVGGKYYVSRNDSSLIAFHYANDNWAHSACRLFGAHTDSPCLKVKPNAEIKKQKYLKLGVEVYGGVLLNPWFDRDLSMAGRVVIENDQGRQQTCLVNFNKAIALIPSLAIHLDREANMNRSVNAQKDITPILLQLSSEKDDINLEQILLTQIKKQHAQISAKKVIDFELSFYDAQKASYVGLNDDFFASARLDNLLSCFVGLQALINAGDQNALVVINDHEEVGSQTAEGAQGAFLSSIIDRICGSQEKSARCLSQSLFISADNAHGIHPNFPEKHDENHGPLLNAGPVIKINANQRYATNSVTAARFKQLAASVNAPTQSFVVRSDMTCGSTIGPITSANLGIKAVDVGVPTFAMHSIRESAGAEDAWSLYKITQQFFQEEKPLAN